MNRHERWHRTIGFILSTALLVFAQGCGGGKVTDKPVHDISIAAQTQSTENTNEESEILLESLEVRASQDASNHHVDSVKNEPKPEVTRERFLLLAPRSPLIVEIAMSVGETTLESAIEPLVEKALLAGDSDGDGVDSWDEVLSHPRFMYGGFGNMRVTDVAQHRQVIQVYDTNRDGQMNRDEVVRFITNDNAGGRSFSLEGSNYYRNYNRTKSPSRLLLDADQDGALSVDEIEVAGTRLRSRDDDDDGVLYWSDLVATAQLQENNMSRRESGPPTALALGSVIRWSRVLYSLEELYAFGGRLSAGSFPLTPTLFQELDKDQDGAIVEAELESLLQIAPHIALQVRFQTTSDNGSAAADLELVALDERLGDRETMATKQNGRTVIEFDGFELDLLVRDSPGVDGFENQAESLVSQYDKDANNYLDDGELPDEIPELMASFDAVDLDRDAKVFATEIAEYQETRQAARRNQVYAHVSHREDALLASLDKDGDGRINEPELFHAGEHLKKLDLDNNGRITVDEIPDSLVIAIGRGDAPQTATGLVQLNSYEAQLIESLPRWFLTMDANRDGFVSRREFVGSLEKFQELDASDDEFIDRTEATSERAVH